MADGPNARIWMKRKALAKHGPQRTLWYVKGVLEPATQRFAKRAAINPGYAGLLQSGASVWSPAAPAAAPATAASTAAAKS